MREPRKAGGAPGWRRFCALLLLALLAAAGCARPRPGAEETRPPESVASQVERAEGARAQGDFETAIQAYGQALERTPWNDRIRLALAYTHAERAAALRAGQRLTAAEEDLRTALELAPDDPQIRWNLGVVLFERSARELDTERARALRVEARALAPDAEQVSDHPRAAIERRLDLAYELLERGQLDAGIERLESLHAAHSSDAEVTRLLAQAHVRRGTELSKQENFPDAGRALDRAVELYDQLGGCAAPDWSDCDPDEVRLAHYNRIVAWLNASQLDRARRALEHAERIGLAFPRLRAAAEEPGAGSP